MKNKGKASLFLGLVLLLLLLVVVPAVARPESAPASNIEKVTLVHYPAGNGFVKPAAKPTPGSNNDYYKLLRVSWDVPAGGVAFTLATEGWPSSGAPGYQAVGAEMEAAFEAWDAVTATTDLFKDNIEYGGVVGPYKDNKNTVSFGPVSYAGALAVTTYWYNRATGRFVEADIEFSTSYRWGIDPDGEGVQTLDSSTFDVRNVGTHEVGHVVGLADLYRTNYSELTMYGYAAPAETLKRSLQNGDILGTQKLYGL